MRLRKIYNNQNNVIAIELHTENLSFPVLRYDGEEINNTRIAGKLVEIACVVK